MSDDVPDVQAHFEHQRVPPTLLQCDFRHGQKWQIFCWQWGEYVTWNWFPQKCVDFFASGFSPSKRILWTKFFRKHNVRIVLFVLTYELILSTNGSVIGFCSCHRQHVATSHRKPKNSVQTISRNSKNCLVQKKWPNALLPWRQNLRTLALVACRCPARLWLTQKLVVLNVKDWNAIE